MKKVSGSFDVKITPTESNDPKLGLMHLNKTYSGSLEARGTGRMLTGMTDVIGSAGYVAIEKVEGALDGLKGTFLLQHWGIQRGESRTLTVHVVPDSGTGELAGLEGIMEILVVDSVHQYSLQYSLAGLDMLPSE